MYRNHLRLILGPSSSFTDRRDYSLLAERTTEFPWRQVLPELRTQVQKKPPAPSNPLHVIGDVNLPDKVRQVLKCGPKFAVEPRKSSPELLGMVRNVSKPVPEGDVDRCVSEGVDVLMRVRPTGGRCAIQETIRHLKDNSLALLPADKDGGFAVMRTTADKCIRVPQSLTSRRGRSWPTAPRSLSVPRKTPPSVPIRERPSTPGDCTSLRITASSLRVKPMPSQGCPHLMNAGHNPPAVAFPGEPAAKPQPATVATVAPPGVHQGPRHPANQHSVNIVPTAGIAFPPWCYSAPQGRAAVGPGNVDNLVGQARHAASTTGQAVQRHPMVRTAPVAKASARRCKQRPKPARRHLMKKLVAASTGRKSRGGRKSTSMNTTAMSNSDSSSFSSSPSEDHTTVGRSREEEYMRAVKKKDLLKLMHTSNLPQPPPEDETRRKRLITTLMGVVVLECKRDHTRAAVLNSVHWNASGTTVLWNTKCCRTTMVPLKRS
ncbi:hypothetical protein HPB51_007073 [Rhipicephalus microplus]|uniref:Uncharacterized protein n=1 Tax=Rhipicephalus microplus TaxID=6941 RepID=A0A9J6DZ58_RHIMP|nr:hypothetical protein HPB51_007073 [Rhipicephalus microplus]